MANILDNFEFSAGALGWALVIALARMIDVALAVLRLANTAAGRKKAAWLIGFFEALIWVFVVAGVIKSLTADTVNPIYAIAYALGFASGTFLGITLEQFIAKGEQVVRVFTHSGDKLAEGFRARGFRVTQMDARGRDGPIQMLFIHVPRKQAASVPEMARQLDQECFIVVDDVRSSSAAGRSGSFTAMHVRK